MMRTRDTLSKTPAKKGLRGRGTKRNETPVNASGTVSHLDKKLPESSCAANRRAEIPLNVTGNPVFRLNAIIELTFLPSCYSLFIKRIIYQNS